MAAGLGKLLIVPWPRKFSAARLVRYDSWPTRVLQSANEIHFQHILFATDFSPDSLAALPYAVF